MEAKLDGVNVAAKCPDCGDTTTFEPRYNGSNLGVLSYQTKLKKPGSLTNFAGHISYQLLRCARCGRGAMSKVTGFDGEQGELEEFWPIAVDNVSIPAGVPKDIESEYREAEKCIAFGAYRAASALLRSTLEKALKANGYTSQKNLQQKIDEAAADGILTATLQKRSHDEIRDLGNDVLHDEYRQIEKDEVTASHHYVHRILEAFYDHRPTVEATLKAKGRLRQIECGEDSEKID